MSSRTLRLIFGDQLNASHHWYKHPSDDVFYLIAELPQELGYVKHHVQKICAFFAAMEAFASALNQAGHQVLHLTLDDTQHYDDLPDLLAAIISEYQIDHFEYQLPDERRLRKQLECLTFNNRVSINSVSTEHFLLDEADFPELLKPQKHNRLDTFYRHMRKRFNVLMEGDHPMGGKWNYDAMNRASFSAADLDAIPQPLCFSNDVSTILARLDRHKVTYFGTAATDLLWPINRQQSLQLLHYFCEYALPLFGQFQDAMTENSANAWSLYHSRLSFALNAKILHPWQVITAAIEAYEQSEQIDIAQIEGFVRQILGWREYVRGVYWINSESYSAQNTLNAQRPLPRWFWDADTQMNCLHHAIKQSLDYSYAHHIQRLMIVGNFSLLAGLDPDQVEAWYLGIYIDAIEWVEQPNTRSMALFADGGWVATKPYIASGNYIHKMSDYCKTCRYNVKQKTGPDACPLNSLYWHFLDYHKEKLGRNPRLAFPYKNLGRMDDNSKATTLQQAKTVLADIENL